MKPILEHLPLEAKESFVVRYFDYNYYPTPWHFHPEYELVLVTESTGKRFIGDRVTDFKPGDLVLLGPNLPHLYRNDPEYYEEGSLLRARSIVVHFLEKAFGENFLAIPETGKLQQLFQKAQNGIAILGHTNKIVTDQLFELLDLAGFARWLKLLEILNTIAISTEYEAICTYSINGENKFDTDRLNTALHYIRNNFKEDIYVEDVAEMVSMTATSFSRYFKQRTRKSFAWYIREVRLTHACQMLIENSLSVSEICFACGFNNLSNFNRQFSNVYQVSPLVYRKRHLVK